MLSKLFVLLFFSVPFLLAQVQDSVRSYSLPPVYISATKTALSPMQVSSTISSIELKEIEAKSAFTLYDALKDEFGLSLARYGGPGQLSYIYTRGAAASQTLIMLDGIELNMVNDPTNTVDLANIMLDNIERIEIVRGPQSTLYGSEAFGGIINLFSKTGNAGSRNYFLSAEGGSYNTYRAMAGLSGQINNLSYSLQTAQFSTQGFSAAAESDGNTEKDATQNFNILANLAYSFNQALTLRLTGRYTQAATELDQFGGLMGDDPTYIFDLEESGFKANLMYQISEGSSISVSSSYGRNFRKYKFDSTLFNPAWSFSRYDGNKFKNEIQGAFSVSESFQIVTGIETEKEEAVSDYFYSSAFGDYLSTFPKNSILTAAVFLQAQVNILKNLSGSYGVRLDNQQKFGNATTFRIAQSYLAEAINTKLKLTFGNAFKSPSLFYLYDPAYGNSELNPEKSLGWELGFEHYLTSLPAHFGAVYFQTDYKELFGFDDNFKAVNINSAVSSGVELYLKADLLNNLNIKANYTYMKTADKSSGSADEGQPLLRRPTHKVGFNCIWTFIPKGFMNLQAVYTGAREDKDFSTFPATRKELSPFVLVNAAFSYDLFDYLKLFTRFENLFDVEYQEVLGYGHPAFSVYGGIKLNFN